jgi:hypothetical protein
LTAIAQQAEAAQLSIFAPDQPDYLVPPEQIATTAQCAGYVDGVSATTTPGVYRATGWIYDTADSRTARAIVITDDAGKTLGTGVTGGERDDVRKLLGRHAGDSGWTAFFKLPASGSIRINGQIAANGYCAMPAKIPKPVAYSAPPQ